MSEKGSLQKLRILKELYFSETLSYAELSNKIHKSLPLTMSYVNEMVQEGIVQERGFANSSGGRRPQLFSINKDHLYVIAVAMDQVSTRMAVFNGKHEQVGETKKISLSLHQNKNALKELTEALKVFLEEISIPKNKITGIGIGMPGFINPKKGANHTYFYLPPKVSINDELMEALGVPVMIDNDSSLIALAEQKWGQARNKKNVMVLNIGWGIGLGMIINGELFRGHRGFAGEFSHITLFNNDKLCQCGKYGCLETETSLGYCVEKAWAAINAGERTSIKMKKDSTPLEQIREIMNAAKKGDALAIEIFSEAGENIGRGASILVHLLNPEIIITSGVGSEAGKVWVSSIQQGINKHSIPIIAEAMDIRLSELGAEAELIGAAALVMENFDKQKPMKELDAVLN